MNLRMQVLLFTTFVEDDDTLVSFAHLEMVLKMLLFLKQKRFGLKI